MAELEAWLKWLETPWARLFYRVARANLERHLGAAPLRILDVGGGNGVDAVYLAQHGHVVTLVDASEAMVNAAREQARAAQLEDRITCYQADVRTLERESGFDVVLCHNVVQYVEDPAQLFRTLRGCLKDSGILSIIGANRYSESYTLALQRLDFEGAEAHLETTTRLSGVFGKTLHLYTPEQMTRALDTADCTVIGQYGIRCLMDYIPDNDTKHDPAFYQRLERLELAMADRYPYYVLARYFHFIARAGR